MDHVGVLVGVRACACASACPCVCACVCVWRQAAALEMSTKIKGERGGSTTVVLCEEGTEVFEFWETMPVCSALPL